MNRALITGSVTGLAGAITILIIWGLGMIPNVTLTPEIASAITTVVSSIVAYVSHSFSQGAGK